MPAHHDFKVWFFDKAFVFKHNAVFSGRVKMPFANLQAFQNMISQPVVESICGQELDYLLVTTTNLNWIQDCKQAIEAIKSKKKYVAIGVIAKEGQYQNMVLCISRYHELDDQFYHVINIYINNLIPNPRISDYFNAKWAIAPTCHLLTFILVTDPQINRTYIEYRIVAPAYREKGLMKNVSFALIRHLLEEYGEDHVLQSCPVHPATYQFFHPHDRLLANYYKGETLRISCKDLLTQHATVSAQRTLPTTSNMQSIVQHLNPCVVFFKEQEINHLLKMKLGLY